MQFTDQQKHYEPYFPQASHEMILAERQLVGRLHVDHRETEIRILDITLLPQWRGPGIGTRISLDLMKEAEHRKQTCSIYYDSFSRSLVLVQRLGFVKRKKAARHG